MTITRMETIMTMAMTRPRTNMSMARIMLIQMTMSTERSMKRVMLLTTIMMATIITARRIRISGSIRKMPF